MILLQFFQYSVRVLNFCLKVCELKIHNWIAKIPMGCIVVTLTVNVILCTYDSQL